MEQERPPIIAPPLAPPAVVDFGLALFTQTPRAWVTPLLLGLNVAVFAVMILSGVSVMNPTSDSLLRWGADFGPYVSRGEIWRLLTNTFVHVGAVHLLMNMIGLWQIGLLVERLLGNAGYLVTYLLAGLAGSLTSMAVHPFTVSAGASGAIFGIYGALVSYLLRHRGSVPRQALSRLQSTAITFVGFNVFFGLRVKGIDMAAHSGGFVGGGIVALFVSSPLGQRSAHAGRKALLTAAVGLALVLGAARLLPRTTDLAAELAAFTPVERQTVQIYDEALERVTQGKIDDAEMARIIDQQVLPPWHAFRIRFAGHHRLMPQQQHFADEITRYLQLREDAWIATADAFRRHDHAAINQIGRDLGQKLNALDILKAEKEPQTGSPSAQPPRGEQPGQPLTSP